MSNDRRVTTGSEFEGKIGYCRALRVGNRILVSGTAPSWPDGSIDPDPAVQTTRSLEIISDALEQLGSSLQDVVRTRVFIADAVDGLTIGMAHGAIFGDVRPTTTSIVVGLLDPRWKVEIEAEAIVRSM
jgi:enamine deaminase RidA (YjgF/YER057c/UK114 family)